MRHTVLVAAISLAVFSQVACSHESTPLRRQISVDGQASMLAVPDQGSITLSVNGRAVSSGDAMKVASNASQALVDALQAFVPVEKIRASQTQVRSVVKGTDRNWRRDNSEPMEMLATRTINVERVPVEKLGEVMNALTAHPLASIDGVNLQVSNASKLERKLSLQALDDAKSQATAMAKRLGMKLGLPISVQTYQQFAPQPKFAMRSAMAMDSDGSGGYEATGENEISARVSVVFELDAP